MAHVRARKIFCAAATDEIQLTVEKIFNRFYQRWLFFRLSRRYTVGMERKMPPGAKGEQKWKIMWQIKFAFTADRRG